MTGAAAEATWTDQLRERDSLHGSCAQKSRAVWGMCYSPVDAKALADPCGFSSTTNFDTAVAAARDQVPPPLLPSRGAHIFGHRTRIGPAQPGGGRAETQ